MTITFAQENNSKQVYLSYAQDTEIPDAKDDITVLVDGKKIDFDVQPIIENERTLVPVRAIVEALGAEVTWNGAERRVDVHDEKNDVSLWIDERNLKKNAILYPLDVPAKIIDGRTLIPVRAVSEAFDCDVIWENDSRQVIITKHSLPFAYNMVQKSITKPTTINGVTVTVIYSYPAISAGIGFLTTDAVNEINSIAEKNTFEMLDIEDFLGGFEENWQYILEEFETYPNIVIKVKTNITASEKYGTVSLCTSVDLPHLGADISTATFNRNGEQYLTLGSALNIIEAEENKVYYDLFGELKKCSEDVNYPEELMKEREDTYYIISDDKVVLIMSSVLATGVGRYNWLFSAAKKY